MTSHTHITHDFTTSHIFYKWYKLGDCLANFRLLSALTWCGDWRHFDLISSEIEKDAENCITDEEYCKNFLSAHGTEYTDIPGEVVTMLK